VTAYHAGVSGTFDKFKIVAAIAGDSSGYYDALASAQATFDMFKLAGSVEATQNSTNIGGNGQSGLGYGASAGLTVSDGVSINIGGRYFDGDTSNKLGNGVDRGYQAAIGLVAAVTETLTLEGDIGLYGTTNGAFNTGTNAGTGSTTGTWTQVYYGAASAKWAPGGGFTSSVMGQAFSNGAYKATFNASKSFQ
jgi:hypothetical protein